MVKYIAQIIRIGNSFYVHVPKAYIGPIIDPYEMINVDIKNINGGGESAEQPK